MENMSKFAERLDELIFDAEITVPELAAAIGITPNPIYRYLRGELLPHPKTLVRMADYFHCTLAYLLGMEEENSATVFCECPPFSERFEFLLKKYGKSKYRLSRDAEIPESLLFQWSKGTYTPTTDNLIKLAKYFECSMDYIIGRLDY